MSAFKVVVCGAPALGTYGVDSSWHESAESVRARLRKVPRMTQKSGRQTFAVLVEVRDASGNVQPEFNQP